MNKEAGEIINRNLKRECGYISFEEPGEDELKDETTSI